MGYLNAWSYWLKKCDGTYEVTQTKSDQGSLEQQVRLLTSVVMRQGEIIQSLQSDLLDCKYRQMRQNILVHGLPEGPYHKLGYTLNTIMSKDLQLKFPTFQQIYVYHRIGAPRKPGSKPRPVVVKCMARKDAECVVAAYRDQTKVKQAGGNANGSQSRPFYFWITPHYPEELVAKRRKLVEVVKATKARSPKADCKLSVNELYVNGERYKEPVIPPVT